MVNCHHEEALNYNFKHKRANKFLFDAEQLLSGSSTPVTTRLQSRWIVGPTKVQIFSLTIEVDIEATNIEVLILIADGKY